VNRKKLLPFPPVKSRTTATMLRTRSDDGATVSTRTWATPNCSTWRPAFHPSQKDREFSGKRGSRQALADDGYRSAVDFEEKIGDEDAFDAAQRGDYATAMRLFSFSLLFVGRGLHLPIQPWPSPRPGCASDKEYLRG